MADIPENEEVLNLLKEQKGSRDLEKGTGMKFVLGLDDGRNEPVKDLNNATRIVLVDQDTVGAKRNNVCLLPV